MFSCKAFTMRFFFHSIRTGKQTERIHILADWIKVVAFAFAFLQCCLCCRPAGLFPTPKSLFLDRASFFILAKQPRSRKRLLSFFWPHARSGKRHFGVEKKSSPLQALPQAARIALHEQLRAPLELQGDSARNLAFVRKGATSGGRVSLWGGCSSSMFCVGYRPRFETWVRIRHFAGLSILQCAGRSSSNLWCSKMLAKSLQTALRGPPASNFAGLRLANQHLQASEAFWQLAALPSRF